MSDYSGLHGLLDFISFGGNRDLELLFLLATAVVLYAVGNVAHILCGNYVLALRIAGEIDRGEANCRMWLIFSGVMTASWAISWTAFEIVGPPYDDVFWVLAVLPLACVLAAAYTTARLGRWPGLSHRFYRRLALPTWGMLGRRGRYYTQAHIDRYERLRARRLGLPAPYEPPVHRTGRPRDGRR